MSDGTENRHEALRQEEGPTSRRQRALRRLRSLAGRYRKRYWTAATLALVLGAAFALSAAGVFEDENETPTLGTGRAGVMSADSSRADSLHADSTRADSLRQVQAEAAPPDTSRPDTLGQQARQGATAEADNTGASGETSEEVTEVVGQGEASYYGAGLAGNPTASGETFDPSKLTAAHRTLPLGSRVRVTNLRNDETVTVRINDRGPYHGRRILDLSRRAAEHIGMVARGKARVKIELLGDE